LKVAVAVLSAIMENVQVPAVVEPAVTEQLALVTLAALPPQAVNRKADWALAVRVTVVPLTYLPAHVPVRASGVVEVAATCVQLI